MGSFSKRKVLTDYLANAPTFNKTMFLPIITHCTHWKIHPLLHRSIIHTEWMINRNNKMCVYSSLEYLIQLCNKCFVSPGHPFKVYFPIVFGYLLHIDLIYWHCITSTPSVHCRKRQVNWKNPPVLRIRTPIRRARVGRLKHQHITAGTIRTVHHVWIYTVYSQINI